MNRLLKAAVFVLLAILVGAGCTHTRSLGPAYIYRASSQPIEVELRNFSFSPDHLAVLQNRSRDLRLINSADRRHNFTLLDPENNVILSKNLGPKEFTALNLELLRPGNYLFYCNRFLHRYRGMEGMLMID